MLDTESRRLRGRIAVNTRHLGPDDPAVIGDRRELRTRKACDYLRQLVTDHPSLSVDQRERIAAVLR